MDGIQVQDLDLAIKLATLPSVVYQHADGTPSNAGLKYRELVEKVLNEQLTSPNQVRVPTTTSERSGT